MRLKTLFFSVLLSFYFQIQFTITYGNVEDSLVISKTVNGLKIAIDGRQELLSIVQYLGGSYNINVFDLQYKEDIDAYFADFKQHKAVKYLKELAIQGFDYDAPPATMLYLSHRFNVIHNFPEYLTNRAGGEEKLIELARLLKKFAKESRFDLFFSCHHGLYNFIIKNVSIMVSNIDEISHIEEFYGEKKDSYNIILSVLNSGNYGPKVINGSRTDIYNIISTKSVRYGLPGYGSDMQIEYLIWHEFGHSFVNDITHENIDIVNHYKELQIPISKEMKEQAYDLWETIVNESVIRAITAKFAVHKYGKEKGMEYKMKEIYRSFYYVEPLYKHLDTFLENRNTHETFADFYPTLIKEAFEDALINNYPANFLQSINKMYNDTVFIVISKDEKNDSIEKELKEYVKKIFSKNRKEVNIIYDDEANNLYLSKDNLIIYGTYKNNLLLQKFKNDLPILISDSCIYADKKYTLINGKVIFNFKNPLNQDKHIVVYTAQQPEGLIDINRIFHGPTNYVVANSLDEIVYSGYFIKENEKWECK